MFHRLNFYTESGVIPSKQGQIRCQCSGAHDRPDRPANAKRYLVNPLRGKWLCDGSGTGTGRNNSSSVAKIVVNSRALKVLRAEKAAAGLRYVGQNSYRITNDAVVLVLSLIHI